MKFGKEFSSQMVPEWQQAYMNYGSLKKCLKDIIAFKLRTNHAAPRGGAKNHHGGGLSRKMTLYRTFSGLVSTPRRHRRGNSHDMEEGVPLTATSGPILVNTTVDRGCETTFLMAAEEGGEYELVFFRRLDDEFNKVSKFYKEKVEEVLKEAVVLNKQMDALIAFRVKVENPEGWGCDERAVEITQLASDVASSAAAISASSPAGARSINIGSNAHLEAIQEGGSSRAGRMEDVIVEEEEENGASVSTIARDVNTTKMRALRPAPIDILDRVWLNDTKETPRSTIKGFLQITKQTDLKFSRENLMMIEEKLRQALFVFYQKLRLLKSYSFLNVLAFSKILKKYDKVVRLMERVEATFIKHFANANRTKGMNILRPKAKRERHRLTFSTGFLGGCIFSLIVALAAIIRTRHLLQQEDQEQYMNTMFPLYSLFGFIVLHIIMYAANIYYWKRYKVTLPDFFLGDQLTSQVQALRSIEFYICYYGWGDFRHRKNTCNTSTYKAFIFIVAVIPYLSRLLQCMRRLFEEKNQEQGWNGLKYFLTIVAVCLRTAYSIQKHQVAWRILAAIFSIIAAIFSTWWDFVHDWGLLNRTSKNRWLRDKLLIPQKQVYFVAMILNVLLRFAWIQTVLDFKFSFMHRETMITVVASLEIIRRGIWNFFRLENEHLNNVGKYRAFKSVPLPFNYDEDEDKDD
ncbi:hypothetical protein Bca4012_009070 [Brassica carinata]